MRKLLYISLVLALFSCSGKTKNETLVSNIKELSEAIKNASPGDVISMKNGVWKDAEIEFVADGLANKPIVLKAETAGKVFVEGQSYVKIAGHFLELHGLYFRNGYTPINSVIQFKKDKNTAAYDCKVVDCVIENFTQLDRTKKDHWIEFWGQRNQLVSCYLAGKSNNGPTLRVELKGNQHANCYHLITDNYFGPRPRRGGPRGETMQLGDSYTSMVPAYITVSNNLFDRCNGEVEVISSKSNYNQFTNNIFNKCEGSLVLRHGNYVTIDSNWFIGDDNSDNIGGVRVINTGHWITNNYFYKIKGNEFRSALAVMNGIPKSPLNRYNQVTDVVVAHNSYVDCITPMQFSVGSNVKKAGILPKSEIRSALPIRTIVANNLVYNSKKQDKSLTKFYDQPGDITFKNNYVNEGVRTESKDGFVKAEMIQTKNSNELPLVTMSNTTSELYDGFNFSTIGNDIFANNRTNNQAGAICSVSEVTNELIDIKKYGPAWFSESNKKTVPRSTTIKTAAELYASLKEISNGDILILDTDVLEFDKPLNVNKTVVISSANPKKKVTLQFSSIEQSAAFVLGPGVDLHLNKLTVLGTKAITCIVPNEQNMSIASNVFVNDCSLGTFKSIYKSIKGSFADTIQVANSSMSDLEKGFILNSEDDAKGDYNAEFLILEGNDISNVKNNLVDYYRGGYDESTIGGNFVFKNNTLKNSGKRGSSEILLKTEGIVNVAITDNRFSSIKSGFIARLWGEKNNKESGNSIIGKAKIKTDEFVAQKLMY